MELRSGCDGQRLKIDLIDGLVERLVIAVIVVMNK